MKTQAKILRQEGVRGGSPVIAGTRITVTDIVRYYRLYLPELVAQILEPPDLAVGCVVPMSAIVKEICAALPHLSDEQVYAAFVYWRDNKVEIEKELQEEDAAARELERLYSNVVSLKIMHEFQGICHAERSEASGGEASPPQIPR